MRSRSAIITTITALFLSALVTSVVRAQPGGWNGPVNEVRIGGLDQFGTYSFYSFFANRDPAGYAGLDIRTMIALYGEAQICAPGSPRTAAVPCVLTQQASQWRVAQSELLKNRHAEGMVVTAMRNYLERDPNWAHLPTATFDYRSLAQRGYQVEYTSTLTPTVDLFHYVDYYQTARESDEIHNNPIRMQSYGLSAMDLINRLTESFRTRRGFYTLEIIGRAGTVVRPLLPIAVDRMGGSAVYKISVYDAYCPNIGYVMVTTGFNNKFSYQPCNGGANDFQGPRALTPLIARFPDGNKKFTAPFWRARTAMNEGSSDDDELIRFSFNGSGNILITDPDNKQVGYDGKTKKEINQVRGARVIYDDGDSVSPFAPRYALPIDPESELPYRVLLSGDDLKKETDANLTVTGPGFVVGFEKILLDPKENLSLSVSPDGRMISFTASTDTETPSLFITGGEGGRDDPSYCFKVGGVAIAAGKTMTMTIDIEKGKVFFKDNDGKEDAYDIEFLRTDADGTLTKFVQADVTTKGRDSFVVDISEWDDETKPCIKDSEGNAFSEEDCGDDDEN